MIILLIALLCLGLFAMIAGIIRQYIMRKKMQSGELTEIPGVRKPADSECCGQHEVCEKESLLAAVSKKIEYYDDEELDQYKNMNPENYTPEQEEDFRNILYTMRADDVAGWVRSLQLRNIELPNTLKDEVFLIVGERRNT